MKMELMSMFDWAGVPATCEAWGLFSHLVPQAALAREEVRQQVEVMRPDFRVELRSPTTGQVETCLAELKFYCGRGLYKAGVRQHQFQRAVEGRSIQVRKEDRDKADRIDDLLGEDPGRGRVRARLDQFGEIIPVVSGLFNEDNDNTLHLLDTLASSWVDKLARAGGLQTGAG